MKNDHDIELSGPFKIVDATGGAHDVSGIRIFDEGYGIIDVYVDFADDIGELHLYDDAAVIRQILAQLRGLGYQGPDFGHADLGLQDDKLVVLEAPEEFNGFAAGKGWKNLAAEFDDDDDELAAGADAASQTQLDALMRKFRG
jgi:hypothetical protein